MRFHAVSELRLPLDTRIFPWQGTELWKDKMKLSKVNFPWYPFLEGRISTVNIAEKQLKRPKCFPGCELKTEGKGGTEDNSFTGIE